MGIEVTGRVIDIDPEKTMKVAIRELPEEVFQVTGIDNASALKTQDLVTVVYGKQGSKNVVKSVTKAN